MPGFLRNSSSLFPGLCHLVLTCSHDSLFLRYPAIDIVWRGSVFLASGFLRHLALRGSAWWSPGLGWCSRQSFSRTSVLPFLTLTHALTVYTTPPVVSALASNPNGEFVTVLCLRSHHCLTVSGSAGQWFPMMRTWECGRFLFRLPLRVPLSLPFGIATFGSVAAFLSTVPPTVVPMDDVRCGLRLFLSSCRNPSGRWKPLHVAYPIFPGCARHWLA